MFWIKRIFITLLGIGFLWVGIYVLDFAFSTTLFNKIVVIAMLLAGVILILSEIIRIYNKVKSGKELQ